MFHPRAWALVAMIAAAAFTRLIPHPPNFTAIGAIALFGGAFFSRGWLAFLGPLAAMAISDLALGFLLYGGLSYAPITYVCFALTVIIGMALRNRATAWNVGGAAVLATVVFFLLSNFHVWLGGRMYPQTLAGLLACYAAAIPFARNMLLGNLFYCGVLFGGWALLTSRWPVLGEVRAARAA